MSESKVERIDADLVEVPVVLKKDGKEKSYLIREMMGDVISKFIKENAEITKIAVQEDGNVQLQGMSPDKLISTLPSLLKHCLYDDEDNLVDEKFIGELPIRVQTRLMEIAQEVNGLTKKTAKQAGNLQSGSELGISLPPTSTALLKDAEEKPVPGDSINGDSISEKKKKKKLKG